MDRRLRSEPILGFTTDAKQPSVFTLTLAGSATRVALILLSLANGIVLARVLGPTGLGHFFVFLQIVALLAVIAEAGVSHSAAAFFGRSAHANGYMHGLVLRVVGLSTATTLLVAAPVVVLLRDIVLPDFPTPLLVVAFASLPFAVYSNVWMGMMAGLGRIVAASVIFLTGTALWVGLTLLFVAALGYGEFAAGVLYGVALLLQAAIMVAFAGRIVGRPTLTSPTPGTAKSFLSFAARSYPGAVTYLLWTRMPIFLLNAFQGPAAVGIFSAAQQLAERTLLPIAAIQAATLRDMSTLSRTAATLAVNRYVRFVWWTMLCTALAGIALADPIVRLLLGGQYLAAVSVCRMLFLGLGFSACALVLDSYFMNQLGRPGLLSVLAGGQVLLVFGLGVLLIPPYGVTGAAAALILTQAVGTLLYIRWHLALSKSTLRDILLLTGDDIRSLRRRVGLVFLGGSA